MWARKQTVKFAAAVSIAMLQLQSQTWHASGKYRDLSTFRQRATNSLLTFCRDFKQSQIPPIPSVRGRLQTSSVVQ